MTFNEFKATWTPVIDNFLREHLESEVTDKKISQIMSYSVMAGGKRLQFYYF